MYAANKYFLLTSTGYRSTLSADMPIKEQNYKEIIGENVRRLRIASGRSVGELAPMASMARGYWYEVERAVTNPTLETLSGIAITLGVTVRELITEPKKDSAPKRPKKSKRRAA